MDLDALCCTDKFGLGVLQYIHWYTSHEIVLFPNLSWGGPCMGFKMVFVFFLKSLGGAVAAQRGQTGEGQWAQNGR